MAKPLNLTRRFSIAALLRPNSLLPAAATPPFFAAYKPPSISFALSHSFSTTLTPYPLQYDMIVSRPVNSPPRQPRRRLPTHLTKTRPEDSEPESELGFNEWVDKKLTANQESGSGRVGDMDKSKRKYYNKKMKRMYGSDSEDDGNQKNGDEFVELKPEVVELNTLHKREEELYFYDTFAYPWEKEKHYKMVYQLEKKYFPDQCFDKAFLEPGELNDKAKKKKKDEGVKESAEKDEKGLVFFDEERSVEENEKEVEKDVDVSEKKVEEFFNTLKKFPRKDDQVVSAEPFVASRRTGLPSKWDSPTGTVVLVNKPKGKTCSVCEVV